MVRRALVLLISALIALVSLISSFGGYEESIALAAVESPTSTDAPIPPLPSQWVTDTVGFLSPDVKKSLDNQLQEYERTTGHQVIVWIGGSLQGFPLDEWATRTFEAWKLGRKDLDDGLALFILAEDRKIAIEVGYGLEDKVPDALAARVINDIMAPKLKTGLQDDRDEAVTQAVDALLSMIEGRPVGPGAKSPLPGQKSPGAPRPLSLPELIGIGIVGVMLLILFIKRPGLALWILYALFTGRGGRDGGGGGGGGGFGGGGGRSGGGGARGGW